MPEIKVLFFDCDNTLIMSEPIAFKFCAITMNELLEKYGYEKRYTGPELLKEFVGMNFRGMAKAVRDKYGFSKITDEDIEKYVIREMENVIVGIKAEAVECEGAIEQIRRIYESGKYANKMAVVSSSAIPRVTASLERVGMDKYFKNEKGELAIFSCASRVPPTSKPDPQIYFDACEAYGVKPENTLTIEDSRSGATSAKNAGVNLIGYVGPYETEEEKEKIRNVLKNDCNAIIIMEHWREWDDCLAACERK